MSETVNIKPLRKVLQRFNEDLGVYINDDQRFKLGRVLTIIDASISDPEQRKAIKDLINNEWWGPNTQLSRGPMSSPHTDLRGLCQALGFELYEDKPGIPENAGPDENAYAAKRYEKVSKEE
jgi:hypothetical protein